MHCKINPLVITLLAMVLVSCLMQFSPTNAYAYETVSATTGEVDLGGGVKIRLTCEYRVSCYSDSYKVNSGNTYSKNLKMEDGKIIIAVFVPYPINEWYQTEYSLYAENDITSVNIPISNFVSANVRAVPTATLSVSGPATLNVDTLTFDSMEYYSSQKGFYLSVHKSAHGGETITVKQDFNVDLRVGLSLNFFTFEREVASTYIGLFSMNPTLSETYQVSYWYEPVFQPIVLIGLGFMLLVSILIAALILSAKKRKRELDAKQRQNVSKRQVERKAASPAETKSEVYCMFCGAKLPSTAIFCRKCGRKQE